MAERVHYGYLTLVLGKPAGLEAFDVVVDGVAMSLASVRPTTRKIRDKGLDELIARLQSHS